jgi:hypothetical protein
VRGRQREIRHIQKRPCEDRVKKDLKMLALKTGMIYPQIPKTGKDKEQTLPQSLPRECSLA